MIEIFPLHKTAAHTQATETLPLWPGYTFPRLCPSEFSLKITVFKKERKKQQQQNSKKTTTQRTFWTSSCFPDFFFFLFLKNGSWSRLHDCQCEDSRTSWLTTCCPSSPPKIHAVMRNENKYYLTISFSSSYFFIYNFSLAKSVGFPGQSIWKYKSEFSQWLW